jgi:2-dehydro-3-deoxyphosphogluconate aldolase / (4S)-4-hydroxy-2-oxoglutarate aldolase
VRFIPTGGVTADNLARYLEVKTVLAVGGSWMVAPGLLAERRFDDVRRLTAEAVDVVRRLAIPTAAVASTNG